MSWVPAGRRLVMLEGGYDLDALAVVLRRRALACSPGARRERQPGEAPTAGGPGQREVDRVGDLWRTPPLGEW